MNGYAAFARVERGRVSAPRTVEAAAVPALADEDDVVGPSAASASSGASRLQAVIVTIKEQWSITTFYLFDADSWH